MQGLERVPAVLIGATVVLLILVLALVVLGLFAVVLRRFEESNAHGSTEAMPQLWEDADPV